MRRNPPVPPLVYGLLLLIVTVSGLYHVSLMMGRDSLVLNTCVYTPLVYLDGFENESMNFWLAPFCHAFLHTDLPHLLLNLFFFLIFATPIVRRISTLRAFLFILVTIPLSVSVYLFPFTPTFVFVIGASGLVSAFLGALLRLGLWPGQRPPAPAPFHNRQTCAIFLAVWFLLNLFPLLSIFSEKNIAWQAHLFGFAIGFILYPLFEPVHRSARKIP